MTARYRDKVRKPRRFRIFVKFLRVVGKPAALSEEYCLTERCPRSLELIEERNAGMACAHERAQGLLRGQTFGLRVGRKRRHYALGAVSCGDVLVGCVHNG